MVNAFLSMNKMPELAQLTPEQRQRAIFLYEVLHPTPARSRFKTMGLMGLAFLMSTAGCAGVFHMCGGNPYAGIMVGVAIAFLILPVACYGLRAFRIQKTRRFFQSAEGQALIQTAQGDKAHPQVIQRLKAALGDIRSWLFTEKVRKPAARISPTRSVETSPPKPSGVVVDLGERVPLDQHPSLHLVHWVLREAIQASADEIKLSLTGAFPDEEFRITYTAQGQKRVIPPPPGNLFTPMVLILCNYASVPYKDGTVKAPLKTQNPASSWLLVSKDLKKTVYLAKGK